MFWRIVLMAVVVSWPVGAVAATIPPVPAEGGEGFFTHDYMQVLTESSSRRIAAAQDRAFKQKNTPIIVVTIHSMSAYEHEGNIESFARKWFDAWRIGTANQPGGANKGILLLVSIGDRKARIELGGDWQRNWDDHALRIMDQSIVPFFRQGAYGEGIASGVEGLAEMAAIGPAGTPPHAVVPPPVDRARHDDFGHHNNAPMPIEGFGGGVMCFIVPIVMIFVVFSMMTRANLGGGYRRRRHRRGYHNSGWTWGAHDDDWSSGFGGITYGGGRSTGSSSSRSGSSGRSTSSSGFSSRSSGGGYSGGSSGGGGASGSW